MNDEIKTQISDLLSHTDPDVRRRAAQELGSHRNLAVIAALAAAMNDANKGVRDAVRNTLLEMGGENVARAIVEYIADENIVTRNLAGALLQQMGVDAVPAVLPYLTDANRDVRKFAVDLLGLIGSRGVAPRIELLLKDEDDNVVVSAVEALGNLRSRTSVPALVEAYRKLTYPRSEIVEALGKIGGGQALEFLIAAFKERIADLASDQLELVTLAESIGHVGDDQARMVLLNRMPDVRGKLRNMMLHAIVTITERIGGEVGSLPVLRQEVVEALTDPDPVLKGSAAKILAGADDGDATRALIDCTGVDEALDETLFKLIEVRTDALDGIADRIGSGTASNVTAMARLADRVVGYLLNRVHAHESISSSTEVVAAAFDAVAGTWNEADEETRSFLVETLFRLDGDRTVGFLDTIMKDSDPWLRMRVIEQLARIEDRRVPMFVHRFLQDEDEMVQELAMTLVQSRPELSDYEKVALS